MYILSGYYIYSHVGLKNKTPKKTLILSILFSSASLLSW